MEEFLTFLLVGFLAQLVDGSLGMAYGLVSTTLLLSLGFSPLTASATTHTAECITTGFSALAHHQFGNVNKFLFKSLLLPGMIGALLGSLLLVSIDSNFIKPFVAVYLMGMGIIVFIKSFQEFPPRSVTHHLIPLGFFGAFLDAIGGGGWGPIVTSTLLARGNDVRTTIGSVNACEFFVAVTSSFTFFLSGIVLGWKVVIALALGGAVASPCGAWVCKHVSTEKILPLVGLLIIALSARTLWVSLS